MTVEITAAEAAALESSAGSKDTPHPKKGDRGEVLAGDSLLASQEPSQPGTSGALIGSAAELYEVSF